MLPVLHLFGIGILFLDMFCKLFLLDFEMQVVLRAQSKAEARRRAEKQC
jgi:hypothetical protein